MSEGRRTTVRTAELGVLAALAGLAATLLVPQVAAGQVVAYDMVGSADLNLVSYSNPYAGAFSSAADGFQKYQRGVSATIPFAVLDDSLSIFPTDNQGIIKEGNADVFFAAADTENPENSGPVSATWTFDVSGATTGLILSVDMGAMGNFESNDFFEWSYSIDGGPELTAFSSSVDEAGSHTYTLEGGASVTLDDPMTMLGQVLTNDLRAFSAPLAGLGSELTVTLTAQTNGSGEAFAFQNLILSDGDTPPPPPTEVEIYTIQGSGSASLFDGWTVTTRNNAVTALAPNGFFMQTPTDRSDGDDDTSDGIFVFTGGAPGVSVGQRVDVTGEVDEFFGFTEIAGSPTVEVSGTGDLPAAVVFDATRPTPSPLFDNCAIEFECWEGMLVSVPAGTVTGPHLRFGSDPFAEVLIVTRLTRAYREEGIEYPGLPTYPVWDGNPEIFEMDPDKLISPTAPIPAGSTFSATGVLGFEFGDYELWPTTLTVSRASVPVPVRERNAGEFTVGTLNVFRLFDDFDDDPDFAADGRERDDAVVSTTVYQRRLQKLSDYIRNVLRAPDILAIQEVEKLDVLVDLADRIAADDTSMVYSAHLVEGNDVGTIDIGFLTRRQIQVDSITQVGKTETFINPEDGEPDILHDRPPLLLEGSCQLEYGSFPIAVMTVHNRSLSSINTERVRQKRFEQAESIAQKVQDLQIADADVRLVVIGDFNAFQFTDGYVDAVGIIRGEFDPVENLICETNICTDLVAPNLTNEVTSLDPADRYSFVFEGSAQVLDHALTTTGLATEMTGAAYGRGNADAALEWLNDDSTPLRSSDHDGMVVYILKDEDNDGVPNDDDACPGTTIPESVPIERLGVNRFALVTEDGIFDTALSRGMGPRKRFTVGDTAGCSCEQIIAAAGLGYGHSKFGCSISAMEDWILLVQAVATAR